MIDIIIQKWNDDCKLQIFILSLIIVMFPERKPCFFYIN